jgi:hypothetical protein
MKSAIVGGGSPLMLEGFNSIEACNSTIIAGKNNNVQGSNVLLVGCNNVTVFGNNCTLIGCEDLTIYVNDVLLVGNYQIRDDDNTTLSKAFALWIKEQMTNNGS